jgi:hypothetical protein
MDNFGKGDMSLNDLFGIENEYELMNKSAKVSSIR